MTPPLWLVGAFALIAALYSAAGLGGGTAYAAALTLAAAPVREIPPMVLLFNAVVGGIAFAGRVGSRLVPWRLLLSFAALSVPAAFLGGLVALQERQVLLFLSGGILLAGVRFLAGPIAGNAGSAGIARISEDREAGAGEGDGGAEPAGPVSLAITLPAGALLGLFAGMTGIGGGVFLGPALLWSRTGTPRSVTAVTSGFVFLNSVAGLAAHLLRGGAGALLVGPLLLAAVLGAMAGTAASIRVLPPPALQRALGLALVLVAALRLASLS